MEQKFVDKIGDGLHNLGITLSKKQTEQFFRYYELLIEWNKMVNLTAITEMDDVITKHFVDSLSLIKVIPDAGDKKLEMIDVGTGAGFPGIPLKIAFPQLEITLLDSLNKRVKFLNEVIAQLELSGIRAVHGRAEDFGRDEKYRERYDYCVSRAVANMAPLSEYCLPYVKVGGAFISYKSGKAEEELESSKTAVKKLGGNIREVNRFLLPGTDAERVLVVIEKIKTTEKKYPRKAGIPAKEPL